MERVSEISLIKMKDYIQNRNNATRLGMVELVAQYVMHDLEDVSEEEKEELGRHALLLAQAPSLPR